MNAQYVRSAISDGRPDVVAKHLDTISQLGVGYVRANLAWRELQPLSPAAGDSLDLAVHDAWMEAVASRGLSWQVTAMGAPTPDWAIDSRAALACGSRSPPARTDALAEMLKLFARRYGRRGSFWEERPDLPYRPVTDYEIWNEPNHGAFWCPRPDPERYGKLFAAAAAEIRSVDPRARIILGGLAPFDDAAPRDPVRLGVGEFLRRAVPEIERRGQMPDAVALHLYAADPAGVVAQLRSLAALVDATRLRRLPLVVNEFGWPTMGSGGPPPVAEETRSGYLDEVTRGILTSSCDVVSLAVHTWFTPETNPADAESWYGLADPASADPYPSASGYVQALRMAGPPGGSADGAQCRR